MCFFLLVGIALFALIEAGDGFKVKAVETFDGRELGQFNAPLNHATFAVDQLELSKAGKIPNIIAPFCGTEPCQLIMFAQEGGEPQAFKMMGEQYLRNIIHDEAPAAVLAIKLI
jgi:hypothetical protein